MHLVGKFGVGNREGRGDGGWVQWVGWGWWFEKEMQVVVGE